MLKEKVSCLESGLNNIEQHGRRGTVRIFNLEVPKDVVDTISLCSFIFSAVIQPIVKFAGTSCPFQYNTWWEAISTAHPLKSRPGKSPPIICKFISREFADLVLKFKGAYLRSINAKQNKSMNEKLIARIGINPDLTRINLQKMNQLKKDQRVNKVWFTSKIKFTLHGCDTVHTCTNPLESISHTVDNRSGRGRVRGSGHGNEPGRGHSRSPIESMYTCKE